jgi:hypothetical protein
VNQGWMNSVVSQEDNAAPSSVSRPHHLTPIPPTHHRRRDHETEDQDGPARRDPHPHPQGWRRRSEEESQARE